MVDEDAHFMLSGGDSLQALRLYDEITVAMGTTPAGLLEVILDGSFLDVLSQVVTEKDNNVIQPSKKRMREDSNSVVSSKRQHKDMTAVGFIAVKETMGCIVVRRAGEVIDWSCLPRMQEDCVSDTNKSKMRVQNSPKVKNADAILTASHENNPQEVVSHQVSETERSECSQGSSEKVLPLGLKVVWSSDTGRCVDASPVLLVAPERTTVFIGSHSHRLQALNLRSGEVIWERILGDRLESSAAITKCGTLVAVGVYPAFRRIYIEYCVHMCCLTLFQAAMTNRFIFWMLPVETLSGHLRQEMW